MQARTWPPGQLHRVREVSQAGVVRGAGRVLRRGRGHGRGVRRPVLLRRRPILRQRSGPRDNRRHRDASEAADARGPRRGDGDGAHRTGRRRGGGQGDRAGHGGGARRGGAGGGGGGESGGVGGQVAARRARDEAGDASRPGSHRRGWARVRRDDELGEVDVGGPERGDGGEVRQAGADVFQVVKSWCQPRVCLRCLRRLHYPPLRVGCVERSCYAC